MRDRHPIICIYEDKRRGSLQFDVFVIDYSCVIIKSFLASAMTGLHPDSSIQMLCVFFVESSYVV